VDAVECVHFLVIGNRLFFNLDLKKKSPEYLDSIDETLSKEKQEVPSLEKNLEDGTLDWWKHLERSKGPLRLYKEGE